MTMRTLLCLCLVSLMLWPIPTFSTGADAARTDPPTPPGQPLDGPGGSNYTHAAVTENQYGIGAWSFWLFEPAEPTPAQAPVIVFNHGYSAVTPYYYQAWITHLVKRGNIVIYPRYQLGLIVGLRYATLHAIWAVHHALAVLNTSGHVAPDLDKFAIVGHSLGGGITAEMAAKAATTRLPIPRAVMPVQPYIRNDTMLTDYHDIPAETLLLIVVGEDDNIAGTFFGKEIFTTADQIPSENKDYVIQRTDRYGSPAIVADHVAPVCPENSTWTNTMDYYSTWKLFDALTDYAFYGTNHDYALGNTTQQRFMGLWSDGTPVKELTVTDTP
jgi:hypothetical protein